MSEGDLLWEPTKECIDSAPLTRFERWLNETRGLSFADYEELRRWSVTDLEGFWSAIWDYFNVISDTPYETVLDHRVMPGARWFDGTRAYSTPWRTRFHADGGRCSSVMADCVPR